MTNLTLDPESTHSTIAEPRVSVSVRTDHSRLPELDGVRAIAIWMVLLAHIFYAWPVPDGTFARIPGALLQAISHGWLGVDLFFVLSGFLITGVLLDSRNKHYYFRNFYARRFLRIMPLYFTVVFAFVIFYPNAWPYCLLSTFFAANLAHMFGITVPHGPGALWSLAVEEHFYLLWPVLVYVLDRRKLAILAASIIVATPIARGIATAHGMPVDSTVYVYSWFRFDGLALGGLMAMWVRSPKANRMNSCWVAAACVSLSILITVVGSFFGLMQKGVLGTALRYNQAQFPFAAFLLMAFTFSGTRWTQPLRTGFARASGDLSYCIYLIHVAIGDGFEAVTHHFNLNPNGVFGGFGTVMVRGAFILVLSFALAALSKKYLEEPFLRLKKHFSDGNAARAAGYSTEVIKHAGMSPASQNLLEGASR
jgi:peptidoglycan/LPS O-acetylase OafA/YrhL